MATTSSTTVLITAAGSAPAVAVIQALLQQQEIPVRLVAADMDPLSAGFYLAHQSALIPGASDPDFIGRVQQVCREHEVSVVFPIIDEELQLFADHAPAFAALGVHVVSNPPEVVRIAKDKWLTWQWCCQHGVRAPKTWLIEAGAGRDEGRGMRDEPARGRLLSASSLIPHPSSLNLPRSCEYPLIVKPRAGRGSVGVHVVRNEAELSYAAQRAGTGDPGGDCGLLVQEYVEGPEFTVDVLCHPAGQVLSAVPRERLMTKAGMCVKGRTAHRPGLMDRAVRVAEAFGLAPRGNLQFKQSRRDGEYYLIEVNPKFGAGLPLTTAAGVNMPLLLLKLLRGDHVPPMLGEFQAGLVMLRHWAELFVSSASLQGRGTRDEG